MAFKGLDELDELDELNETNQLTRRRFDEHHNQEVVSMKPQPRSRFDETHN
jgi:hypothetical protein